MRTRLILLGVAVLLAVSVSGVSAQEGTAAAGPWGTVSEGFQLGLGLPTIASDQATGQSHAVMLPVTLTNATDQRLIFLETYPENECLVTVTDGFGRSLPVIGYAGCVWGMAYLGIDPGEQRTVNYNLTRMFGVLPDGDYTITAKRAVFRLDGEGLGLVESGALPIAVSGALISQGMVVGAASRGGTRIAKAVPSFRPRLVAARPVTRAARVQGFVECGDAHFGGEEEWTRGFVRGGQARDGARWHAPEDGTAGEGGGRPDAGLRPGDFHAHHGWEGIGK